MSTYTLAVEHNLTGLEAVSTGLCPGCQDCADAHGYETLAAYDEAYEAGEVCDEGSFSWVDCDICDSSLGGDRYVWHAIIDGEIHHWSNACVDCVAYLANGTEPEKEA